MEECISRKPNCPGINTVYPVFLRAAYPTIDLPLKNLRRRGQAVDRSEVLHARLILSRLEYYDSGGSFQFLRKVDQPEASVKQLRQEVSSALRKGWSAVFVIPSGPGACLLYTS